MNIGQAAELTDIPAKTLRYYEDIDLVRPDRQENGYRDYSDTHIHKLRFIKRARNLGFSIDHCRLLLSLYEDKHRASADVKNLARARLKEIDQKIQELESLRATLKNLITACKGDKRPDCPIIDDLAGLD